LPSVFGARRRLTTSATATTYGHSARSSHDPRRDGHLDALPFLNLPRPLPCGSGDRRRAAQRSPTQTPVPVPPGFRQVFPTAIPASMRHLRELPRRSASGDQRARVRGPSEGRVNGRCVRATFLCSRVRCMRFEECMRTSFPSSAPSGHPLSPVRHREGRRPVPDAGPNQDPRSDVDPRRSTPSREPGCLPPLRPRQAFIPRIAPLNESCASVPRSRRPHVLHKLWRGAFTGLASARVRSPAIPGSSRNKRLCYRWDRFFRISRAWD
jgi:hypothetical protein